MQDWDFLIYNLQQGILSIEEYPKEVVSALKQFEKSEHINHTLVIKGSYKLSSRGNYIKDAIVDLIDRAHYVHAAYTSKKVRILALPHTNLINRNNSFNLNRAARSQFMGGASAHTDFSKNTSKYKIKRIKELAKSSGGDYAWYAVQQLLKMEWVQEISHDFRRSDRPFEPGSTQDMQEIAEFLTSATCHNILSLKRGRAYYSDSYRSLVLSISLFDELFRKNAESLKISDPLSISIKLMELELFVEFIVTSVFLPRNENWGDTRKWSLSVHNYRKVFDYLISDYLRSFARCRPTEWNVAGNEKEGFLVNVMPSTTDLIGPPKSGDTDYGTIWELLYKGLGLPIPESRINFWNDLFYVKFNNSFKENWDEIFRSVPTPLNKAAVPADYAMSLHSAYLFKLIKQKTANPTSLASLDLLKNPSKLEILYDVLDTTANTVQTEICDLPLQKAFSVKMTDSPYPQVCEPSEEGLMIVLNCSYGSKGISWKEQLNIKHSETLAANMYFSATNDCKALVQWHLFEKLAAIIRKSRELSPELDAYISKAEKLLDDADLKESFPKFLSSKVEFDSYQHRMYDSYMRRMEGDDDDDEYRGKN